MIRPLLRNNLIRILGRYYSENSPPIQNPISSKPVTQVNPNVSGLSSAVVHTATQPVGPDVDPGKTGAYKVPEYFCYDNVSFFEAEVEMAKYRLPQPSALK